MEILQDHASCQDCHASYPMVHGEVLDFAPLEGFRDPAGHAYTYSYSSRIYELWRKSRFMKRFTGISYEKEREVLVSQLNLGPGLSILDVGCGTGLFSRQIARQVSPGEVWGLDYSYHQLRQAVLLKKKEEIPNLRFLHARATPLPLRDGTVDRVCTVGAMQFFGDPSAVFLEARRVLTPGGVFVGMNYLSASYVRPKSWLMRQAQRVAEGRGDHFFSRDELMGLARNAGFEVSHYEEWGISFVVAVRYSGS